MVIKRMEQLKVEAMAPAATTIGVARKEHEHMKNSHINRRKILEAAETQPHCDKKNMAPQRQKNSPGTTPGAMVSN